MIAFELIELRQRHSTFWQCVRYLWRNRRDALALTEHLTTLYERHTECTAELSRTKEQLSQSQQECERFKSHSERLIEAVVSGDKRIEAVNRMSAEGAAELAKLRDENPTLRSENAKLTAENERLRKSCDKLFKTMTIRGGFDNERPNDAFQALTNVRNRNARIQPVDKI